MIVLLISLIFLGCFALYNTSQKAPLQPSSFLEDWLQKNKQKSKVIGSVILTISVIVSIYKLGTTSGFLFFLFTITALFSAIIIITPLKKVGYKSIGCISVLLLILELIF